MVRSGDIPVHLETMEPGAMYCVKAQALVKAIGRHSAFSQPTCVEMKGKDNLLVPGSPHLAALLMHAWMPISDACLDVHRVSLVLSLYLALKVGFQAWWILK